ncbi:right-handed parallel beta-helix repeat-containing protein [Salinispora arenicola]|uniref:right-handed parallel beta-helix repeat-containing protein n=1 Tax=Salinispora arenicola TaxID=168697 RepID=UPI0016BC283F|nr:right-handed parallel beta-helix repeat-containing protein [Salinispora arenicola]NIL55729.1 right-handed parallel beta-helix repeat-containing protein [Salinispora arenicola]NIL61154.1 right-handed parallel beta-helix repeat-containing protein [Salinispora arenicola]
MTHQHHTHEPDPERPVGRRARSRWAVGLAGVTGLALAAVGVSATPAADTVGRALGVAGDKAFADEYRDDGEHDRGKGRDDRNAKTKKKPRGIPVPCDADRLIAEITFANARGGGVLDLAPECTYTLTTAIDGAGLPAITAPITLNGGTHTTITRAAAAADQFRILTVGTGGDLTLHHLKITGGRTADDGGGILVNAGGSVATKDSEIVYNVASGMGGGIANNGLSTIEHTMVGRNTATGSGAVLNNGVLVVNKSQISFNSAAQDAGIGSFSGSSTQVDKSAIVGNRAESGAGAILVGSGSTGRVTDTRITKNTTSGDGAISVIGPLTLKRVVLDDNTSTSLNGGALFIGGGFPVGPTVTVEDSHIKNNSAGANGGAAFNQGVLILRRTKVAGNLAGDQGGGILNAATGTVRLFDTKVTKNIAVADGGGIFNDGGTVELNTATGTVVVKNRPNNCVGVTGCAG